MLVRRCAEEFFHEFGSAGAFVFEHHDAAVSVHAAQLLDRIQWRHGRRHFQRGLHAVVAEEADEEITLPFVVGLVDFDEFFRTQPLLFVHGGTVARGDGAGHQIFRQKWSATCTPTLLSVTYGTTVPSTSRW